MSREEPDNDLFGEGLVLLAGFRLERQVERRGELFERLAPIGLGYLMQMSFEGIHRGQPALVGNHAHAVI